MQATAFFEEMLNEASKADDILTDIYACGYKIPEDKAPEIAAFCEKSNALYDTFV